MSRETSHFKSASDIVVNFLVTRQPSLCAFNMTTALPTIQIIITPLAKWRVFSKHWSDHTMEDVSWITFCACFQCPDLRAVLGSSCYKVQTQKTSVMIAGHNLKRSQNFLWGQFYTRHEAWQSNWHQNASRAFEEMKFIRELTLQLFCCNGYV